MNIPKFFANLPVTDFYTRPLGVITANNRVFCCLKIRTTMI